MIQFGSGRDFIRSVSGRVFFTVVAIVTLIDGEGAELLLIDMIGVVHLICTFHVLAAKKKATVVLFTL